MSSIHLKYSSRVFLLSDILAFTLSEIMNVCVIMHNIIIEDECAILVHDPLPYEFQDPLDNVDHNVPADWTDFIAMHMKIGDEGIHQKFQNDLTEHPWAR